MKKLMLLTLALFLMLILLTSCDPQWAIDSRNDNTTVLTTVETAAITATPETVIVTETIIDDTKVEELQTEVKQYQDLISNLDSLLKNVYYVYGEGNGTFVYGTGFSLEYKDKFYLITAGHIVDGEWGIHKNLGFKSSDDEWIYPKLLDYENIIYNDYAIFKNGKVLSGFKIDNENDKPLYYITIKGIKLINEFAIAGDSGSSIIDIDGEVVGIQCNSSSQFTKIDKIMGKIDNLKN